MFTTTSVALQCGIILEDEEIYVIEISDKGEEGLMLSHSYNISTKNTHDVLSNNNSNNYDSRNNSYEWNEDLQDNNNINNNNNKNINQSHMRDQSDVIYETSKDDFKLMLNNILKSKETVLCFSGPSLSLVLERIKNNNQNNNTISILEKLLLTKSRIFYRMLPDNKSALVSFFQKDKNTIVSMCGDGANDCSAFMTSDVGIAICQTTGNNLISHFYTKSESIACIEQIIKNGRAFIENKILIIKYMILYSFIQICTALFLNLQRQILNVNQYLFLDLFYVLLPSIISSKTLANYTLSKQKLSRTMFDGHFLASLIGHVIIDLMCQIFYGMFITPRTLHTDLDLVPRNDMNILTTYMYLYSLFQYLAILFIMNTISVHRKPIYTNKLYLFYFGLGIFASISFVAVKEVPNYLRKLKLFLFEDDSHNFEYRLERNKVVTMVWLFVGFLLSFLYERLVFYICVQRKQQSEKKGNNGLLTKRRKSKK